MLIVIILVMVAIIMLLIVRIVYMVILMLQSNLSQKVEVQDWLVRRVSSWLEDS